MITSSSTGAATTAALPTSSRQTEQRFSQTSTAAATPRPQCLSAPIIGAEDANTDLADFEYEVFQFRDSLEIARAHFGHAYQSTSPPSRPRECESAKRAAFPFGRNSFELAHRDLARARSHREEQRHQQQGELGAHAAVGEPLAGPAAAGRSVLGAGGGGGGGRGHLRSSARAGRAWSAQPLPASMPRWGRARSAAT